VPLWGENLDGADDGIVGVMDEADGQGTVGDGDIGGLEQGGIFSGSGKNVEGAEDQGTLELNIEDAPADNLQRGASFGKIEIDLIRAIGDGKRILEFGGSRSAIAGAFKEQGIGSTGDGGRREHIQRRCRY